MEWEEVCMQTTQHILGQVQADYSEELTHLKVTLRAESRGAFAMVESRVVQEADFAVLELRADWHISVGLRISKSSGGVNYPASFWENALPTKEQKSTAKANATWRSEEPALRHGPGHLDRHFLLK